MKALSKTHGGRETLPTALIHLSPLSTFHLHPSSIVHPSSTHHPTIIHPSPSQQWLIHLNLSFLPFQTSSQSGTKVLPTHLYFLLDFLVSLIPVHHQDQNKIIFKTMPHTHKKIKSKVSFSWPSLFSAEIPAEARAPPGEQKIETEKEDEELRKQELRRNVLRKSQTIGRGLLKASLLHIVQR